jgi:DNA polymerase-3 subunit alpha
MNAPLTEINDELIEELSSLVKSHPGNVELNLHIHDNEGEQINLAAKTLKINVQKDIIAFLKSQTALSYKIN